MAYDQNSSYEPPRRPYQMGAHPPAPVQNSYNEYAAYASTPFDHQDQYNHGGYAQPPPQQYGGYEQNHSQGASRGYGNSYEQAPDRQEQYDSQHSQEHAQQQEYGQDRQYNARYQPRAQQQRPPPTQALGPPTSAPRLGEQYASREQYDRQPPRDQYEQQSNGYAPSANGYGHAQPQQAHHHAHEQEPGKSSMDEWKAKERARMKAEARSPATMPFDNAFPAFGDKKKERPGSKQSEGRSHRGSRDQERRPKTSEGQRVHGFQDNNYQAAAYRPDGERSAQQGRPVYAQQPPPPSSNQLGSPIDQHFDFGLGQNAPPQTNGYHQDSYSASHQQGYASNESSQCGMTQQRGPVAIPHIDTNRAQHHHGPVFNGQQPLSPAFVPPRPSTAHGAQSRAVHHPAVPLSQPQSAALYGEFANPPQKPFARDDGSRPASIGDIYDDYGTEPAPHALQRRPTTREEEIEADMPDFDSAAPAQTSHLQKRKEAKNTTAGPSPPLIAPATHPGLPQSSSAPDVRYEQQQSHHDRRRPPNGTGPPRHDGYQGGASSVPPQGHAYRPPPGTQDPRMRPGPPNGMQPPRAPFAHEPQVRRSLDDGRPMPYRDGPPPSQRLDAQGRPIPRGPPNNMRGGPNGMRDGPNGMNARGGPKGMRGGPNGMRGGGLNARGGPNGMPLGRGFAPRPDLERQGTTWSDPGMGRTGSAPPPRDPPYGMEGPPLTKQRSAPDRNPAFHNADALPQHPVPVRPGLMENNGTSQPAKPAPVRNYGGPQGLPPSQPQNAGAPHERQVSIDQFAQPVTNAELDRLRSAVDAGANDAKQALLLVKKLVEASTVLAAGGRADSRTTGNNREKYIMEAHKRLKKLVNGGYPEAQFYLADCYGSGTLGLEIDPKEAFKLYQAAAKAGHAESAYRTAVCCEMGAEEGGGTSRDYAKAVQWYRRAATLGYGPGMYKLGAVLLKGLLGQQRNIVEAVIWLKRGAEKADRDNPHALHELAQLYESENTNPEIRNKLVADDAYARQLFEQAAGLGYKHSQFRLGQAYEYGALGCTIDNRTSIAYYTKAAAQGEHQAELALSGWYLTGAAGILENSDTEAYLWARKAASSEPPLAKAMFAMGYFTESGIGCPQSMEEARKWYSRAASYKFPKAIERLEELKKGGGKKEKSSLQNGKLSRKDQKKDEENCVVM